MKRQMKTIKMPFAKPDLFIERLQKDSEEGREEFWFIFKNSQLLVDLDFSQPFQIEPSLLKRSLYMGVFRDLDLYVGEVENDISFPGAVWEDLKKLYGKIDDDLFAIAGKAHQLIEWECTHQFCGKCGGKIIDKVDKRAKECIQCNLLYFPNISPVVMALIQKGDEILLARGVNFPSDF